VNNLHVPTNRPVIIDVSSKGRHPQLQHPGAAGEAGHHSGQLVSIWFEATQTGHFELACAQLCGLGHYRMRGDVLIDTPEEFAKWQAETRRRRRRARRRRARREEVALMFRSETTR